MFQSLPEPKLDALVRVGQNFRADNRANKLDLGVGVYRDAEGATPVLAVVKHAEQLLQSGQATKSYLPPDGDAGFVRLMTETVLGFTDAAIAAAQAPGGTGAFHQALALIKASGRQSVIWVGTPTWPNHIPMISHQGLRHESYPYYDIAAQRLRFDLMLAALGKARPGDLFLLHGCCHNPTGADLSEDEWRTVADLMAQRGLIPLIDFAYQGFGRSGDEDAMGVRELVARLPRVLVAASCSKSFSLYRERTGIVIVKCENAAEAARTRGTLQGLARVSYSNPPAHGAEIVRTILSDPEVKRQWLAELAQMRERVLQIRKLLVEAGRMRQHNLDFMGQHTGLFATFALTAAQCERMGKEFAIHMPDTGRINIAGLTAESVDRFVDALLAAALT